MKRSDRMTAVAAVVSMICSGAAIAATQQENYDEPATKPMSQYGEKQYEDMQSQGSQTDQSTYAQPGSSQEPSQSTRSQTTDTQSSYDRGMKTSKQGGNTLSEDVVAENELGKFRDALQKAGLADALSGGQEYTVFAPTDEAFEALDDAKASELMDEANVEQLREVLRSHIVAGKVDAQRAKSIKSARVLTGDTVPLKVEGDKLQVANAQVVKADISAGSLTIHTIDEIIDVESERDEEEAE